MISLALIINDYRSIIDVFELAEPTGSFGIYFHLGGLAAGLAVILVTVCLLLPGSQSAFRSGFAVVAFIPYLLAAIAALPCFVGSRPGALCGVAAVVFHYLVAFAQRILMEPALRQRGIARVALVVAVPAVVAAILALIVKKFAPITPGAIRPGEENST